ncbi:MAG: LuxR family transcriptional regulator, maltose regulon positive regulatory protein [Nocardioidaceae bacterium]|nr:LuxR family transcriptional regulator, maltose regulon positive regulatory protein [Nocardioidaceae bacterium]
MIVRRRLLETLGSLRPLTVVSAPAGYGKSTLVESWTAESIPDMTIVRMALGGDDLLPEAFWPALVRALRTAGVVVDRGDVPEAVRDGDRGRAKALAADILAHGRRVVWILDCGEFALSAQLGRALDHLIHAAVQGLAVVILTRDDPPSALHRYRLEGALCEIRAKDLAFTASEVAALMEREGVVLSPPEVSALRTRTGGWPAGLRFAAMNLREQPDVSETIEDFRGDSGNVAEYLMTEVLQRQPPKRRQFLLRSCIAEELDPPLVEELTGQHCDVQVLEGMADSGCFVERIPGQHDRFRYHALFRQFLRAQLSFERSPAPETLHRLAARWLARHGETSSAVSHAVEATDWTLATTLLVNSLDVVNLLSGHRSTVLRRLFTELPARLDGVDGVDAELTRAALSLADLDPATAGQHLEAAREYLAVEPTERSHTAGVALAVLTAVQTSRAFGTSAALERGLHSALVAEKALRLLPAQDQVRVHRHLSAVVAGCKGRVLLARGDFLEAREALRDGVQAADAAGLEKVARELKGMCALVEAVTGRLRRATAMATQLLHTRTAGEEFGASEAASLALAWVRIDEAEPALAHELLGQAQRELASYDSDLLAAVATLLRARLQVDRGDLRVALAELEVAGDPGAVEPLPAAGLAEGPATRGWLARTLLVAQADVLTRLGRPREAIAVLQEADEPQRRDLDSEVALQRAKLALRDPDRDQTRLATAPDAPSGETPLAVDISRWLVLAEASIADQAPSIAGDCLGRALRLASSEHLRRPILQAPEAVQEMLDESGLAARNRWLHASSNAAGPQPVRLHIPEQRRAPDDYRTGSPEPVVIPLTKKETEVLGHLAKLLTTDEIAAVMFVSVNTVRSHVRSILRKLGVSRRNEAVRRAWDLHLLPPGSAA